MTKDQILLNAELAKRELARRSYEFYLSYTTPGWLTTRFSSFLANQVQSFVTQTTGNAYDILIVETPPQHGKSMTITEALPAWYLGRNPTARVIEASYNEETAERFSRRNKEKIRQFGANLFGHGIGSIDRATEFELDNNQGRMISRGIMSGITGNPANLLVIDDPIKNRVEADSDTLRSRLWDEWQNSLKSRLAAGAKVVVIMTPWHEDDLAARILRTEHNVTLLRLPVEAEEDDPMGREPGEPLCPELGKDEKWLHDFKPAYIRDPDGGARAWSALYQCSPRVEDGNLLKRNWWQYFDRVSPSRTGYLEHQEYYSGTHTYIIEREYERVVDHHEDQAVDAGCEHEHQRMQALYTYVEKISESDHEALRYTDQQVDPISSEEALMEFKVDKIISLFDLHLYKNGREQCAYPLGKHCVERRHARSVIFHWPYYLCIHFYRIGKIFCNS